MAGMTSRAGMGRTARGLVLSCHPMPCVAVTAFAVALGVSAGLDGRQVLALGVAILSGQLSVGWLNDYVDRGLDTAAGRTDKPLAQGGVGITSIRVAGAVAVVVCVVSSFALGLLPGFLHLVAVGSAYSYDLWLKSTLVSWLPFVVSFGLLPAVVTTALPGHPFARPEILFAGATLGMAAHLANTVKDTEADAQTGVRGFPQRIGPRASLSLAAGLVALGAVAVGVADPRSWVTWVFAGAAVVAAGLAIGSRRTAFGGTVVAVALVVAGLVLSGGAVSS
jgi:4-hydroxybenzoate polyprenyltransferase